MVMYEKLRMIKNKRKYERNKMMWPSHLERTGHRWKEGIDKDKNKTGLCAICGEKRVIQRGLITEP